MILIKKKVKVDDLVFGIGTRGDVGEGNLKGVVLPDLEGEGGTVEVSCSPVPSFYTEQKHNYHGVTVLVAIFQLVKSLIK